MTVILQYKKNQKILGFERRLLSSRFIQSIRVVVLASLVICVAPLAINAETPKIELEQKSQVTPQKPIDSAKQEAYKKALELSNEAMELFTQGTSGSQQQAIAKYEEALIIYRKIGDRQWEAITLDSIGMAYDLQLNSELEQPQKALEFYQRALTIVQKTQDQDFEATILSLMAGSYSKLKQPQKALNAYFLALQIYQKTGDHFQEGSTLTEIARFYNQDLKEPQKAIEFYYQAVKAYKLVKPSKFGKNTSLELYTPEDIEKLIHTPEDIEKLIHTPEDLGKLIQNPEDIAKLTVYNLENIAEIYGNLKQPQKAIQAYNQALEIAIQNKDHKSIDILYPNIARIHEEVAEDNLRRKNFHQAIEAYNYAVSAYQKAGKNYQSSVVDTLYKIADLQVKLKLSQSVLATYNRIIELQKGQKDVIGQVNTLRRIGDYHKFNQNYQETLKNYTQALTLLRANRKILSSEIKQEETLPTAPFTKYFDGNLEYFILNDIYLTYLNLGDGQQALNYSLQTLKIQLAYEKDPRVIATILNRLAGAYIKRGDRQKALDSLNQALSLQQQVGDNTRKVTTLRNLAVLYNLSGEPQTALNYLDEATSIQEKQKDFSMWRTLLDQASIFQSLSDLKLSFDTYNRAQQIASDDCNRNRLSSNLENSGTLKLEQVIDCGQQALIWNEIGKIKLSEKNYDEAMIAFKKALKLTDIHGPLVISDIGTRVNIVKLYIDQEHYGDALKEAQYIRDKSRKLSYPKGEAIAYNLIGFIYMKHKLYQKAIDAFEQALPLIQKARFPSIEDEAISSIDVLQIGTNTHLAAQDSFALLPGWLQSHIPFGSNKFNELSEELSRQKTARLRETANELEAFDRIRDKVKDFNLVTEVPIMKGLGQSYDAVKQYSKAISNYNSALALAKKYGDRFGEAETNYLMAVTEQKRGNFKAARAKIEAALNVVEDFRSKVVDPQLRSSYFASVQEYYEFCIDVLMQLHKQQPSQGFNALALQTSERARARSLLDLLNESRTDIRQGVDPKLLEQEKNLQFKLNAREKSRIELYSKTPSEAQKASFEQEYDTLFSQYRNIETRIRASSPRYAALTQPQTLTLNQLQQQVLDDNTVLLEYFLGTKHTYLWAVSKYKITSYELPKESEIEAATQKFITLVKNHNARPSEISKAGTPLSQMLLDPVTKQLGQKRLLIVSNGALQSLPFAALPSSTGSQFLLSEHEIINLPSASTLATLRQELNGRKPAPKAVAVFADPVFSPTDARVAQKKGSAPEPNNSTQGSVSTGSFFIQLLRDDSQEAGINFPRLPGTRTEAKDILKLLPANLRTQALDFEANKNNVLNSNLSQYRIVHFATHGILNTTRPERSAVVLSLVDPQGSLQDGFLRLNDIFNLNLPAELVVLSACDTGLGQNMRGEGLIGLTRGFMYAGSPRVLASLWSVEDESTAELMAQTYQAILKKGLPPAAALRNAQLQLLNDPKWRSPYYWAAFTLQGEWR